MSVYKLSEFELQSGMWFNLETNVDPLGSIYTPYFRPDTLIIYLATSTGDTVYWDDTVTEIDGYIKSVGSLREGFDYRKGTFTYDDVDIEAFNVNEFWSDYIFTDSVKNIEIRIVHKVFTGVLANEFTYEPVFAGKILLDDYEVKDNDDPDSVYYAKTKVYKMRAFNILKVLETKTITDLRTALESATLYNFESAWMKTYGGTDFEWKFQKDYYASETESWDFVTLKDVVKNIFELTGLTVNPSFSFTSDFNFWQHGYTLMSPVYIYDLLIPFRTKLDGAEPSDKGYYYKKMFDDDTALLYKDGARRPDNDKTEWSFYHLSNVMELLCMLFHSFGVVWHIEYTIPDDDYPHLFNLNISCNQRSSSRGTVTVEKLKDATKKISAADMISGYKVTVPEAGDYLLGTKEDVKLNCYFMIQNPDWNEEKKYSEIGTFWEHSLYFRDSVDTSKLRFVDSVSYEIDGTTYNYQGHSAPQINFALMYAITNYYANSEHGIFRLPKTTWELNFLATKATLGSSSGYQYLKPNYSYSYAGDLCIITKTDRDLLKNTTKLEMVKYE